MLQSKLSLASMKDLDFGIVDAAFQQAVKIVAEDCRDRPSLDKDRQVAVLFKIRPSIDPKGGIDADRVEFTAEVMMKVPAKVSDVYKAVVGPKGTVMFRHDEPDDPEANKLFDPETGEIKDDDSK